MRHAGNVQLKTEKTIQKPVSEVYRALSEGRLFMNCGAQSESLELDFRVGGQYRIHFTNYALTNTGEFLEIVPDKKIVFSWCSSFDLPLTPDTTVTIELFPDGNRTRLVLVHAGFKDQEDCSAHEGGWNAGLTDLTHELLDGKVRMVRVFAAPVAKLYETARERMARGKVKQSVPNKQQVFDLESTLVTLNFDEEDDGGSSVEIIHERLNTPQLQMSHRKNWEAVTEEMAKILGRNT